jgi:hypothetical protein
MYMVRSPTPEIRIGIYVLSEAVSIMSTGTQILLLLPEFLPFLLLRENKTTLEGRNARYAIVRAILASPVKAHLADAIVPRQLETYVSRGQNYQKARRTPWDVATED